MNMNLSTEIVKMLERMNAQCQGAELQALDAFSESLHEAAKEIACYRCAAFDGVPQWDAKAGGFYLASKGCMKGLGEPGEYSRPARAFCAHEEASGDGTDGTNAWDAVPALPSSGNVAKVPQAHAQQLPTGAQALLRRMQQARQQ
jgi:hypothetical protein